MSGSENEVNVHKLQMRSTIFDLFTMTASRGLAIFRAGGSYGSYGSYGAYGSSVFVRAANGKAGIWQRWWDLPSGND